MTSPLRPVYLILFTLLGFGGCGDDAPPEEASGSTTDDASSSSEGSGGMLDEVVCEESTCLTSCVRRYVPEGSPGEVCSDPAEEHAAWNCDVALTCPVVALGVDAEAFDPAPAHCVLESLRDRTPGALSIRFDDYVDMSITVLADGRALLDLVYVPASTCLGQGVPLSSRGALELLDAADPSWETCLTDDTLDGLGDCLLGSSPEGWSVDTVFPWQAATCSEAAAACP